MTRTFDRTLHEIHQWGIAVSAGRQPEATIASTKTSNHRTASGEACVTQNAPAPRASAHDGPAAMPTPGGKRTAARLNANVSAVLTASSVRAAPYTFVHGRAPSAVRVAHVPNEVSMART